MSDIVDKMARVVAAKFKAKEGIDLTLDPLAFEMVLKACAEVRPELGRRKRASVVLPCITRNEKGYLHLDVMVFEDEIEGQVGSRTGRGEGGG